ncbi:MAG: hypothetical protein SFU57_04535 [Gemmatimonadales bacterium]|nr:hypothetical protein [Gemmatimonadales bacterium]
MSIIDQVDVKKDSRNRITLPAGLPEEYWRLRRFDDGHIELHPLLLVEATISANTLRGMDEAMSNLDRGMVGDPLDVSVLTDISDSL